MFLCFNLLNLFCRHIFLVITILVKGQFNSRQIGLILPSIGHNLFNFNSNKKMGTGGSHFNKQEARMRLQSPCIWDCMSHNILHNIRDSFISQVSKGKKTLNKPFLHNIWTVLFDRQSVNILYAYLCNVFAPNLPQNNFF